VVFGFYLMSFVAAIITGLAFKRVFPSREVFVLELPPYRNPSLRTILRRAWSSMANFLVTTRLFIVLGAMAIWLLTNLPPGAGLIQSVKSVLGWAAASPSPAAS
jgi:ferrous iron transport protein B